MGQITHEDLNLKLSEEINKSTILSKSNEAKIQEQESKTTLLQTEVTGHKSDNERHLNNGERSNWNSKTDDSKIASPNALGHIKVGQNLTIDPDGTLHASGGTVPDASTTVKGIVQLNNTLTSTSTTQAATANAVKTVNEKVDKLGFGSWVDLTPNSGWEKGSYGELKLKHNTQSGEVILRVFLEATAEFSTYMFVVPTGYRPPDAYNISTRIRLTRVNKYVDAVLNSSGQFYISSITDVAVGDRLTFQLVYSI